MGHKNIIAGLELQAVNTHEENVDETAMPMTFFIKLYGR